MRTFPDYESIAATLDGELSGMSGSNIESRDQVLLLKGSDLKPQPIQWLWKDWLALGKLHILAGAPGQGKTTIALSLAATVTTGGMWPDGTQCQPSNILIWSGEDDPTDTLLPRLLAAGADSDRCFFVQGARIKGEVTSFDPARDMPLLEEQTNQIGGIALLIVDPIVTAVTGDSHKNTDVRRALQPIVDFSQRQNLAVLGISHFSKGGKGADPSQRVVGSVAFAAVPRVVLVAAKVNDPESDNDLRILARSKSNIGPDEGGFEYFIDQAEPIPGIHASRIVWGKGVTGTAKELLADPEDSRDDGDESKDAITQACEFLLESLADGLAHSKQVQKEARENGISPRTLRRAGERLEVIKKKGADKNWYWSLPKTGFKAGLTITDETSITNLANQVDQLDQPHEIGQVGQVGQIESNNEPLFIGGGVTSSHVGQDGQNMIDGQVGHHAGQVDSRRTDKVTI